VTGAEMKTLMISVVFQRAKLPLDRTHDLHFLICADMTQLDFQRIFSKNSVEQA
jgi:hypothetical protein